MSPHALDAPPFQMLDKPLDYLLADHLRHRALCALLGSFVDAQAASREDADLVIAFLTHDLPLHQADEEEDLVPLLRRRATPEDDLGTLLARLRADDRRREPLAEAIVEALSRKASNEFVRLDQRALEVMQAYTASEQKHIALENAVIISLAGVRLHRADLKTISRGMKARRGVVV